MSTVQVWIRATLRWQDEAAFRSQLDPAFAPKVATWDATFSIPYHSFRAEVREVAAANLACVRDAAVVADWRSIPDGAWVVPVDDDDWLAPDLADAILAHDDPSLEGLRWTSSFLERPIDLGHRLGLLRRALFPESRSRWLCTTNNYALRKRAGVDDLLRRHTSASRWFEGEGRDRVGRIEQRLSLMNRTLASQTSLAFGRATVSRRELIGKWRAYRRLYHRALAPELAWSVPYVARMAALMERLRLRG